jgi:simple sugar transport system substrate-binding protein
LVVGFIQSGSQSGWLAANTASFNDVAAVQGIRVKFHDSKFSIANQIAAFEQFIADPAVNVIALNPVAVTGYDDVLRSAKAAGKVVVLEGTPLVADPDLYYTYVGSDYEQEGRKAGAAMCDALKDSQSTNVVEIAGPSDVSAAFGRGKGFREATECHMNILASTVARDWDVTAAKSIMENDLKVYSGRIHGVVAHNDEMAIAAIQAINASGLKAGKDIDVIGFDATADGFKYLIEGTLFADVECNPLLAPQVYDAALRGLNGDTSTPKWIPAQEGMFFASEGADSLRGRIGHSKY